MTDARNELKEEKPHPVQGMRYFPIPGDTEYSSRTTMWLKFLKGNPKWSPELNDYLKQAAKKSLYQEETAFQPAIGDIIFFDGRNDGSAIIAMGNELRYGIPGTGHFTHVSIIVDIDATNGTVLIAEAGGGGITYMRQATIRDLQTGHVFRPLDREYAYQYAQIALDATKFSVMEYVERIVKEADLHKKKEEFIANKIAAFVLKMDKSSFFTESQVERDVLDALKPIKNLNQDAMVLTLINLLEGKYKMLKSWQDAQYEAVFSAPYSVTGMLTSPALAHYNHRSLMTESRYNARHEPGFRKLTAKVANTDYRPWCSRFVMQVLAAAYVEKQNHDALGTLPYPKEADAWIQEAFAKSIQKNVQSLRYLAPKSLYHILTQAKDTEGKPLFKRLGCWVNLDDLSETNTRVANYRYNGGMPDAYGARPFQHAKFTFAYDGKVKSEICQDGVTTEPQAISTDKSFVFLKLKTEVIKQIVEYHMALAEKMNTRTPYRSNLNAIIIRLLKSTNEARNPDDLLLMLAESAYLYGDVSQHFPMPGIKESPLTHLLEQAFLLKCEMENSPNYQEMLTESTDEAFAERSFGYEFPEPEESELGKFRPIVFEEKDIESPEEQSDSSHTSTEASFYLYNTEKNSSSSTPTFFNNPTTRHSSSATPVQAIGNEEKYDGMDLLNAIAMDLSQLRILLEDQGSNDEIGSLRQDIYTDFIQIFANEKHNESDEMGIVQVKKSDILSEVEKYLMEFSLAYPQYAFCHTKNEEAIDIAILDALTKETFREDLLSVYWNIMLQAIDSNNEQAYNNLTTGLKSVHVDVAWNEFLNSATQSMPEALQKRIQSLLTFAYDAGEKKFVFPADQKSQLSFYHLVNDKDFRDWIKQQKVLAEPHRISLSQ